MTLTKNYQAEPWIKTPEQLALYVANFDKRIIQFETTDDYSRLMAFILEWRIKLGIKDPPSAADGELCIKHIMELHSDMSMEDMRLAVRFSFQGLLKVDIRAFQSFSPLYISLIFNAFKSFKDHEMNKILKAKHQIETKPSPSKIDKLESRRIYIRWYMEEIRKAPGYIIDFKGTVYDVVTRYFTTLKPLENYLDEATKAIENEKKMGNIFNKVITTLDGGDTLLKYQKYFAMKELFSAMTIQWVDTISDYQLMGE